MLLLGPTCLLLFDQHSRPRPWPEALHLSRMTQLDFSHSGPTSADLEALRATAEDSDEEIALEEGIEHLFSEEEEER